MTHRIILEVNSGLDVRTIKNSFPDPILLDIEDDYNISGWAELHIKNIQIEEIPYGN